MPVQGLVKKGKRGAKAAKAKPLAAKPSAGAGTHSSAQSMAVITGDLANSRALTPAQLNSLMTSLRQVLQGKKSMVKGTKSFFSKGEVFRGDALQCEVPPTSALQHLIMLKLYCMSYYLDQEGMDTVQADVRLSLGLGPETSPAKGAFPAAYLLSGQGLDKAGPFRLSIHTEGAAGPELATLAKILSPYLQSCTARQARNLLYTLQLGTMRAAAEALGVLPSTISRSIAGHYHAVSTALDRYQTLATAGSLI